MSVVVVLLVCVQHVVGLTYINVNSSQELVNRLNKTSHHQSSSMINQNISENEMHTNDSLFNTQKYAVGDETSQYNGQIQRNHENITSGGERTFSTNVQNDNKTSEIILTISNEKENTTQTDIDLYISKQEYHNFMEDEYESSKRDHQDPTTVIPAESTVWFYTNTDFKRENSFSREEELTNKTRTIEDRYTREISNNIGLTKHLNTPVQKPFKEETFELNHFTPVQELKNSAGDMFLDRNTVNLGRDKDKNYFIDCRKVVRHETTVKETKGDIDLSDILSHEESGNKENQHSSNTNSSVTISAYIINRRYGNNNNSESILTNEIKTIGFNTEVHYVAHKNINGVNFEENNSAVSRIKREVPIEQGKERKEEMQEESTKIWRSLTEKRIKNNEISRASTEYVTTKVDTNQTLASFEYSEEEISIGVHTSDSGKILNINDVATTSPVSTKGHWGLGAAGVGSLPGLFIKNISFQEIFQPPACLVEWQECGKGGECCPPLLCSVLPTFPAVGDKNDNSALQMGQFCSRFISKTLNYMDINNKPDLQLILDAYRRKMLEVINS